MMRWLRARWNWLGQVTLTLRWPALPGGKIGRARGARRMRTRPRLHAPQTHAQPSICE